MTFISGALLDHRTEEEKEKDYLFEELVTSAAPVDWREKKEWRSFPIFDQNGSGSCVAQTVAKMLGIHYWLENGEYVHFSATHVYQRRINKPGSGMIGVDALDIARKGTTLEVLVPSQDMTDTEMDRTEIARYKEDVGSIFKVSNYVILPTGSIETIASVIQQTGKGVMVWFYFTRDEWTDVPEVENKRLSIRGAQTIRHSVTAVDFTLYRGKKALIIEDSWGHKHGFDGQRVITEDFFTARNYFAAYLQNFDFSPSREGKPQHFFARPLEFGDRGADVVALQNILKHEGLFPTNVDSTGYYGSVTAKAVDGFQRKHSVASKAELDDLQGRRVGAKTIKKLNEIYS